MQNDAHRKLLPLAVAALGVVYGDIGTSPLYAFKEAFNGPHAMVLSQQTVFATLSALFWSIMLIVSFKYVAIVLRFGNDGEGGVLALTALAQRTADKFPRWTMRVAALGIFAAALFYGDAVITPAISVLSAIEGLSVATPRFEHFIVPITIGILVALFMIQKHGTSRVGGLFGPITIVWFVAIGALGIASIAQTPAVLLALNPGYALGFAAEHPRAAFLLLSAVFLAMTGGEALYADMGHFGARPIRWAWFALVCPALLLNYFGQGALVLRDAQAAANPFFHLAPDWALFPMVALAAAATVIASQATISGAYSMTLQASRLGYLPRVNIMHTSDTEQGQIYIPTVNWLMLGAVIWLVLEFRSSGALAAAYGIAVSGTMIITTVLAAFITAMSTRSSRWTLLAALGVFLLLEMLFFASNLTKIAEGGWLPITLGICIFTMLVTWKSGSALVAEQRRKIDIAMNDFIHGPAPDATRVPGTAVYLSSDPALVPSALFHNLKHYKVMHETTVFLNVVNENVPFIERSQRLRVWVLTPDILSIAVRYGFREEPDIPDALRELRIRGEPLDPGSTTYFVARSTIIDGPGGLSAWRCALFGWMTRQAEGAAAFYRLPPNRVVELGTQVML